MPVQLQCSGISRVVSSLRSLASASRFYAAQLLTIAAVKCTGSLSHGQVSDSLQGHRQVMLWCGAVRNAA
eukprot:4296252-Pleurochrysis_carterae.AAC.5